MRKTPAPKKAKGVDPQMKLNLSGVKGPPPDDDDKPPKGQAKQVKGSMKGWKC